MKKPELVLRECVTKLSDDNLEFLRVRFEQRLFGDIPECLELMSKIPEFDKLLSAASSSNEFFVVVDQIADQVEKEYTKRASGGKKTNREKEVVS